MPRKRFLIRLFCLLLLLCLSCSACAKKPFENGEIIFIDDDFQPGKINIYPTGERSEWEEELDDEEIALLEEKTDRWLERASFAEEGWASIDDFTGLRPALIACLSQMNPGTGFREVDPDAENPDERYEHYFGGDCVFLFDWDLDGVPELLEHYEGKTPLFSIYDLETGKVDSCSLCGYPILLYDTDAEAYGVYSIGSAYFGWATFYDTIMTVVPDEENGEPARNLLSYRKEALNLYRDENGVMVSDYVAFFFCEGEPIGMEDWLNAYDAFYETHLFVEEADYDVVYWRDISDEKDTPEEWAEKAADALFAMDYRFLKKS